MLLTVHQVTCNGCDAVSHHYDGAIYKPKEIRAELKQNGWRRRVSPYSGAQGDECPACVARATRKAAA